MAFEVTNKKNESVFVLLSLGSNCGNRLNYINQAMSILKKEKILSEPEISSIYETEPVGYKNQGWFLNAAAAGYTVLSYSLLLEKCKEIEKKLGRARRNKWAEREIDIDIILYGNALVDSDELTIPHPRMHSRKFVLRPASEIAGEEIHPGFRKTLRQLLNDCADNSSVSLVKKRQA